MHLLRAILLVACIKFSLQEPNHYRSVSVNRETPGNEQVQRLITKGYRRLPTGVYYVDNVNRTWQQAWDHCDNDGTHLAVINSPAEAEILMQQTTSFPTMPVFHVGLHTLFQKGYYTSIFGLSLKKTGYHAWAPGKPTALANEFCVGMDKNGQLSNGLCTAVRYSICESFV